jgi:hypothetical protein
MAEDAEYTSNRAFAVIAIDGVLVRQEFNDRLSHAHLASGHS